jgi:hypothetical protein
VVSSIVLKKKKKKKEKEKEKKGLVGTNTSKQWDSYEIKI